MRPAHAFDVLPTEPVQPLHHQQPAGHQVGMRAGDDDRPLAGLGQDLGDVEHVVGFQAEVELFDDRLRE